MTDDTTDEIMEATYTALCEHGYASLRMQDIADESTKSKAALHYHYDSKHDLLVAFLEHLRDELAGRVTEFREGDPSERLAEFLDEFLLPGDDTPGEEWGTAILEIKAQGPYDDAFRDRLQRIDDIWVDVVREAIADGVDAGVVREDVDPDDVAEFVVSLVMGTQARNVAIGYPRERTHASLTDYIEERVLVDGETLGVAEE
ncbi:TetR/AcrR family transcriptional regulator [Halobacterium zhouii]|uniref:TetR/AcrR family transcriptional regulator n=1 Tax=Halobacterium zhouii TaxID=2902624 RepID=UPI001E3C6DA7|nr:TetR/AcrR family transcriptional regulator [Halobacterium zhouii]